MAGPEVPFPRMSKEDTEVAKRHGFACEECPIPMHADGVFGGLTLKRELGSGEYTANEIAGVLTITASGTAPNLNTKVQLAQLPIMIWPPQFALYFTNPEIVLPTLKPFKVEATVHTHERLKIVVVHDRNGRHEVPVQNF